MNLPLFRFQEDGMKKMSMTFAVLFGFAVVLMGPVSAQAQQSNFSITPPPIASPSFEAGKGEMKLRGSYISIEGEGLDLTGAGIDVVGRSAFSDTWAGDIQAGAFVMSADIPGGSMTLTSVPLSVNFELQPYKGDVLSAIVFAGPNINTTFGWMDIQAGGVSDTATIFTFLYGAQAGLQLGVKAGDFTLSPFATILNQRGTSSVTVADTTTDVDIEPFTTTSFGMDIVYTPWDLTLSSILQEAEKQDNTTPGYDTTIIQLSWSRKW
jgi:hypothetical protein